jgi:hypothetical protein
MSPRCSKSHYRGDVGKVEELIVELESDEELEAALRREISELSGSDQQLGPEAEEDASPQMAGSMTSHHTESLEKRTRDYMGERSTS